MVLVFLEKEDSKAMLRGVEGQEAAARGNVLAEEGEFEVRSTWVRAAMEDVCAESETEWKEELVK